MNPPAGTLTANCFNGAAAFQPRNFDGALAGVRLGLHASMGPRHFSRGIDITTTALYVLPGASMGPRHFSRGIWQWWWSTRPTRSLQWGRGISAAEFLEGVTFPTVVVALQWGRGISAAELPGRVPTPRTRWGFNGAAAFQPRNLPCHVHAAGRSRASMGPRHFSRGIVRDRWYFPWDPMLQRSSAECWG